MGIPGIPPEFPEDKEIPHWELGGEIQGKL